MTISSTTRRAGPFSGNGATTSFPFAFKIFDKTDVAVTLADSSDNETLLVLDTDYSVTVNADQNGSPGGSITYPITGAPMDAAHTVIMIGALEELQPTQLANNGGFYPATIENALDRAVILIQQQSEIVARAITVPVADNITAHQLPGATARATKALIFDVDGNPTVSSEPYGESGVVLAAAEAYTDSAIIAAAPGIEGQAVSTADAHAALMIAGIQNPTFQAYVPTLLRDGVDYTSGTSTTIVLPATLTPKTISGLFFDGAFQSVSQYSLGVDNRTVTFNGVIPAGTAEINVAYFALSLLGMFFQAGTGAIPRSFQDKGRDAISAKDFGAVGNGAHDDTGSIQAAANSLMMTGGEICLPPGSYNYTSLTLPPGVSLKGASTTATVLLRTVSGGVGISLTSASRISLLKLAAGVAQTAGCYVSIQGNQSKIQDCQLVGYFNGVVIGTIGGVLAIGAVIDDCDFGAPAIGVGSGAILGENYGNLIITKTVVTGTTIDTQQPDFGVQLLNGDTCFIDQTNVTTHGYALYMPVPGGLNNFALRITASLFDSAGLISGGVMADSALIAPTGTVQTMKLIGCWFGLSKGGNGLNVTPIGFGSVSGWEAIGCQYHQNGASGLAIGGPGVSDFAITGGTADGNVGDGAIITGASRRFAFTGFRAGQLSPGTPGNDIGINLLPGCGAADFSITGGDVQGNTTAGLFKDDSVSDFSIKGVLGYNPIARIGVSVGASPWSYTNNTGDTVVMTISGGAVTSILLDGTIIGTASNTAVTVPPFSFVTIAYTAVPTVLIKGV